MTPADRQLLAEIDTAAAAERELFQRLRADIASTETSVAKARRVAADAAQALDDLQHTLTDFSKLSDESLTRLALYDRARREVANR